MSTQQEEIPLRELTDKEPTPEPVTTPKKSSFLYLVAAIANLLSFSTGATITWVTPIIPRLIADSEDNPFGRSLSYTEVSWIAGLLPLGATFGPLVAGKVADKLGRKPVLIILATLYTTALLIAAFTKIVPLLYLSRFLSGLSLGGTFAVLPMYLVEIAESHNRGTLGCSVNIFVACGLNFSLTIGPYVTIQNFSLICLCPLLIFLPSFFLLSPESPPFLAATNEKALTNSLIRLRNKSPEEIQKEATDVVELTRKNRDAKGGVLDLVRVKPLRKGLVIALGLIIFQQLVGVGAIFSYLQTIFESARVDLPPEVCGMIFGAFQILGTVISTTTVDRAGRRILLLSSTLGTSITLVTLGFYFYFKDTRVNVESISWLPILSLVTFIVAFGLGLGPVPWVVVSELFPSNLRSTAASLTSFTCFATTFLVTVTFPSLSLYLGMAKCFFIFSLVSSTATIFVFWVLPETKGSTQQEIHKLLGGE